MAQSIVYLYSERARLLQEIAKLQQQLAYAQQTNSNRSIIAGIEARIQSAQELLDVVNAQIRLAENEQRASTASAGNIVNDDAIATADKASTQHPLPPGEIITTDGRITQVPDTSSGTNAVPFRPANSDDTGTDGALRSLIETQATPPGEDGQGQAPLTDPSVDGRDDDFAGALQIDINGVGSNPGAGAGNDDSGSKNVTRTELDTIFNEAPLTPQPNVLSQYASYTYVASVYLMSQQGYAQMMKTKRKQLNGAQLLFQSGGAPVNGRNPYFSNDYYIEKIQIQSTIMGKGTGAAHNANKISMTVCEPNGITLIPNLDRAVQDYLGSAEQKKRNYAGQLYLMIIKFYGYDSNGNLVRGGINNPAGVTDANAFVEKWYPMAINTINFKVANKLVEYEIEATCPSYQTATGSDRGTIPYNFELSGDVVKDILAGPAQYSVNGKAVSSASAFAFSTTSELVDDTYDPDLNTNSKSVGAPAKANAAPTKKATVRQGLMAALNEYQEQLVKEGKYTYPDKYSIEFVNPSIEQAKIKKPGTTEKNKTSMASNAGDASQKLGTKQSTDTNSRIETITAGTQLVQLIDKVVRNSFYMQDQQIVVFDSVTGKQLYNGTPANNVAYFKISVESTPTAYDPRRNDYAYDIKYIVSAYKINESASNYFYVPRFNGVHKQYKYWFTGENSEVLSYEQIYNALYSSILTGGQQSPAVANNEKIKFHASPRSGMNNQGASGKTNEAVANLADYLFNAGDLANSTMTIIGDPAWLQQGEAFAGLNTNDPNYFRAFLADGTINFESQQIMYEIFINTPRDYNLGTGLMDPNKAVSDQGGQQNTFPGQSQQSYIYRANECVSEFSKGKFTQTIKGSLLTYHPDQTTKANQQTALIAQQGAIAQNALSRLGLSAINSIGSFTSPAFISNISTLGGLTNQALNFGSNFINSTAASILGGSPTRLSATPTSPTSFGLSVGNTLLNSIDTGARGTVAGTEQQMAAGDDIGSDTYNGLDGSFTNDTATSLNDVIFDITDD